MACSWPVSPVIFARQEVMLVPGEGAVSSQASLPVGFCLTMHKHNVPVIDGIQLQVHEPPVHRKHASNSQHTPF